MKLVCIIYGTLDTQKLQVGILSWWVLKSFNQCTMEFSISFVRPRLAVLLLMVVTARSSGQSIDRYSSTFFGVLRPQTSSICGPGPVSIYRGYLTKTINLAINGTKP